MNIKKRVENYIIHTIKTNTLLNEYVPNSHIGKVFSEVYEFIEYYESGEHNKLFEKYNFVDYVNEVFNTDIVNDEIVHDAYQKLRDKYNNLRNFMKMIIVDDYKGSLLTKRVKRGYDKIYNEFLNKIL